MLAFASSCPNGGIASGLFRYLSMANYRIGRKLCGVTWSNNVTEGNGRLVFKSDLEFAMDTLLIVNIPRFSMIALTLS
jgi:hypothetical protein